MASAFISGRDFVSLVTSFLWMCQRTAVRLCGSVGALSVQVVVLWVCFNLSQARGEGSPLTTRLFHIRIDSQIGSVPRP